MEILAWLERSARAAALARRAARARAGRDRVEWFNAVWKLAPNAIDGELASAQPDEARIAAWSAGRCGTRWRSFDGLLAGREFLLGDSLGMLDVVAFPFLKYGTIAPEAGDDEAFHHILHEHLAERRPTRR